MTAVHNKIGDLGEDIAKQFLRKKDLEIVESNFNRKWGELDLIAKKNGEVVFVEVKTVSCQIPDEIPKEGDDVYRPEENVDTEKKLRMRRTIQTYLNENATGKPHWRTDVLCVYIDIETRESRINWLQNVII